MELFMNLLQISIGAVFIQNIVLAKFLGLSPFLGVSGNLRSAKRLGVTVILVMTISSPLTWAVNAYLLEPYHVEYLQTILFILIISSIVQIMDMISRKAGAEHRNSGENYLSLIIANCAILGVSLINSGSKFTFTESLVNGIMSGVGFLIALILMAGIREKLEFADIPKPFQGLPILFITAGLIALAFLGFSGIALK